jgi:methoxymalonate biosynthesis acyl carrier protein
MSEITTVESLIARFFVDRVAVDVPSTDTDLFETAVLDSLAFVDLLLFLEQQFGLRVSLEDVELDSFRSITKIAELVVGWDQLMASRVARYRNV